MSRAAIDLEHVGAKLDEIIDGALSLRLMLCSGCPEDVGIPDDAMDLALRSSPAHVTANRAFSAAVEDLRRAGGVDDAVILDLEALAQAVAATSADVAFRLGLGNRL